QGFGLPILMVPCAFLMFAWKLLKFRDLHVRPYKVGAFILLLLSLDGLFALHVSAFNFLGEKMLRPGGAVGSLIGDVLEKGLNTSGA
ncbi:MAG: DNA translocase FtsK, partial [Desulfuromonadales bacterium]|nr:DNA translocase FtsK [Desulfuromonadales bacterium]NIS41491.1 DNA translocase FtsK [Desulfuromonadales bacterium]